MSARRPSPPAPDGATKQSTKPASGQVAAHLPLAGEGGFTVGGGLSREAEDWLARVDELGACWASVADLLIGEEIDRDKLASLLSFLSREYTAAREGLSGALLAECVVAAHGAG